MKEPGEVINVKVGDTTYVFTKTDVPFDKIAANRVIIMKVNLKQKLFTDTWVCEEEMTYETQAHLEAILVGRGNPWFTKSYAVIRLTACDKDSFSLTGANKKTVNMVRMGDKFYATKLN